MRLSERSFARFMFERYTEKARRTIFFARYEASRLGGEAIAPEHLLLGLMREDESLLRYFLSKAGAGSADELRRAVEKRLPVREKISQKVEMPLSMESKRVLMFAHDEGEALKHRHIGTEHLLLGLLREERSIAARALSENGFALNAVREEIRRISRYD
jgi:ATP-dependent Clp protease ATP-binding subunit ClpC